MQILCLIWGDCMKYLLSYVGNIDHDLNRMLDMGIQNDILLETNFIIVGMQLDNKNDIISSIYRLLWESVYLRRHDTDVFSKFFIANKKICCKFAVSLSEAINYIMNVSPPTNKEKIKEHLNSIESIQSLLDYYLKDTTSQNLGGVHFTANMFAGYKRTESMFKVALNIQQFNTEWNYNNKRFDAIASIMKSGDKSFVGAIDFSVSPIKEFMNKDKVYIKDKVQLSLRVSLTDKNGLVNLVKFLNDEMRVINVYTEKDYLYLTIYTKTIQVSSFSKWISKWYNY